MWSKEKQRECERRSKQKQRARWRQIIDEAKAVPCTDCGVQYPPCVMDLDHVTGEKLVNISRWPAGNAMALPGLTCEETLMQEMAKCEVRCANCHRLRHHGVSA